jgi:tRNA-dihydrouridine synthase A
MHASVFGGTAIDDWTLMRGFQDYVARELAGGALLHDMTRHILGVFGGVPGSRRFRQLLSDATRLKANDRALLTEALAALRVRAA